MAGHARLDHKSWDKSEIPCIPFESLCGQYTEDCNFIRPTLEDINTHLIVVRIIERMLASEK